MLNEYQLDDPFLQQIANIIDEADVAQDVTLDPRAEGLDFVCRGLRLISKNDSVAMERGLLVYDAIYAQLKSESSQ